MESKEKRSVSYKTLFNAAEYEVNMLTGKEHCIYADEFIETATKFLRSPGHSLKIACMCGSENECNIIKKIAINPNRLGEFAVYDASKFNGDYLIVMDKTGFRFDSPGKGDRAEYFNDPYTAKRLSNIFETITYISPKIIHLRERTLETSPQNRGPQYAYAGGYCGDQRAIL